MTSQTTIKDIINIFEENKSTFEAMAGFKFNYTPQSIRKLEDMLGQMFPFGRQVQPQVAIMLGAYFGEVMRKNIKSADVMWDELGDNPFEVGLKVIPKSNSQNENVGTFVLKPLMRVNKFLNHDRTDSIWAMYNMVQDLSSGRVEMEGEGQWKNAPRGYTYRSFDIKDKDKYM